MSDPVNPPTPVVSPTSGRGLKIAFYASLAVNVLVIGLVGGSVFHHWRGRDMMEGPALADLGFGPYVAALDPDQRHDFVHDLLGNAKDLRKNRDEIKAEIDTLLTILRAPELDAAALRASMERQSSKLEERRTYGIELFVKLVSGMSPEKRSDLADRLQKFLRRP